MENNVNKKELQVVFSPDVYDELKYVFRPEQMENIIYKPAVIDEKRWLCSCGFESEMEMCPICGMEKNTAFSKINAGYLSRHRKARIERHSKGNSERKEKMTSMIKSSGKNNKKNTKYGTLIGILILCFAVIVSVFLLFNEKSPDEEKNPQTDNVTENTFEETTVYYEQTEQQSDETTESPAPATENTEPVSAPVTVINDGIVLQLAERTDQIATVEKGAYASEYSGNTVCGGKVYCTNDYDYIAKNGISVYDKIGNQIKTLTTDNAQSITGDDKYIYYTNENNTLKVYALSNGKSYSTELKADLIIAAFDCVFFKNDDGLFSYSVDKNTKNTVFSGNVTALNHVANKVYFSTESGLCMIDNAEGPVNVFCKNGANATSIHEMDGWIFYTTQEGEMNIYYPEKASKFGRTYPGNMMSGEKFTAILGYENNIYFRVNKSGVVSWYKMDILFRDVTKLDISSNEIFVTQNGIYDENLNFISIN